MLAGNVVALLSPLIFIPALTYAFGPQNYDYASMALIRLCVDDKLPAISDPEALPPGSSTPTPGAPAPGSPAHEAEQKKLLRAGVIAKSLTAFMTLALLVLWPMPLYGTGYVFTRKFFTGWVVVGILWLFCSAGCVGLFPLWEGRGSMWKTGRGVYGDLVTGMGKEGRRGRGGVVEGVEGSEDGSGSGSGEGEVGEKGGEVVGEKGVSGA